MFEGCDDKVLWSAISLKAGNGHLCGSKVTRIIDVLETTQVNENSDVGIKASLPQEGVGLNSQFKCLYTNTHSTSNRQEELKTTVQQENCHQFSESCHHGNMAGGFT